MNNLTVRNQCTPTTQSGQNSFIFALQTRPITLHWLWCVVEVNNNRSLRWKPPLDVIVVRCCMRRCSPFSVVALVFSSFYLILFVTWLCALCWRWCNTTWCALLLLLFWWWNGCGSVVLFLRYVSWFSLSCFYLSLSWEFFICSAVWLRLSSWEEVWCWCSKLCCDIVLLRAVAKFSY